MQQGVGESSKLRRIGILKEFIYDGNLQEYKTNPISIDELLRSGAVSKDKTKRYWVENDRDCYTIYARGLNIAHSDDKRCWKWETDSDGIEMAELVSTQWLQVQGKLLTRNLSPDICYKVSFWLKTTSSSTIKKKMVDLHLNCPDGDNQVRMAELPEFDGQWHELEVGKIKKRRKAGTMEFKMQKLFKDGGAGLIIKSVEIKPE